MNNSTIVNKILFDYEQLSEDIIKKYSIHLSRKVLRWLGANHPDNKTRKIFFKLTNIEIGEDTVINQNFIISDGYLNLLKIGNRVAISPNVTIICQSAPNNSILSRIDYVSNKLICDEPVVIGDDAWIGANSVILPGVNIGKCAIIGAGSVVNKNVKDYAIVAGTPAKVIRILKPEKI